MNTSEAKQVREAFLGKTGLTQQQLMTMNASKLRHLVMHTYDPNNEFTPIFVSGVGQPSVDGAIFPDVATQLKPLPVDLLHGFNSGEVLFGPPGGIPGGAPAFFSRYLGEAARGILAQYGEGEPVLEEVIADACMRCQSARYARRVAARSGAQVHFYVYDNPRNASTHGAELPAVFGTAAVVTMEGTTLRTSEQLVRRTQKIWTDFAKGRNLSEVVPGWPRVQGTTASLDALLLGDELGVTTTRLSTARCAAWEAAEAVVGGFVTARMCNEVMVSSSAALVIMV